MTKKDLLVTIQKTAFDLFNEKGFDAVTVMEICRACDITKPTFYKFASSKGALLLNYYEYLLRTPKEGWNDPVLHGSWWKCVEDMMIYAIDTLIAYGYELAAQLYIYNFHEGETSLFTFQDELIDELARILKNAREEGSVECHEDYRQLALSLIDLMLGYVGFWCLSSGSFDVKERYLYVLRQSCKYRG